MAKKLDVPFSLVPHHLDKLITLDCVEHSKKVIAKDGKEHNAYKLKRGLWVFDPENMNDERIDDNKLRRFFKDSVKFVAVGIAGLVTYFINFKEKIIECGVHLLRNSGREPLLPSSLLLFWQRAVFNPWQSAHHHIKNHTQRNH